MENIKIRGHVYKIHPTRDSFNRRATQYYNLIAEQLRRIGLTIDDVEITEERVPIKKAPASASWWIQGYHCHFSFNKMPRFVDNLQVVLKVIEHSIDELTEKKISIEDFILSFKEEKGFDEKRKEAREFFDLEKDNINLEEISKKYKKLAKNLHPDMPNGDINKFKQLNEHHKILKRELE